MVPFILVLFSACAYNIYVLRKNELANQLNSTDPKNVWIIEYNSASQPEQIWIIDPAAHADFYNFSQEQYEHVVLNFGQTLII